MAKKKGDKPSLNDLSVKDADAMASEEEAELQFETAAERQAKAEQVEEADDDIYSIKDLVKRTKELNRECMFRYPHVKRVSEDASQPDSRSDANRREFLDVLFDRGSGRCPHPYFDTFKGFPVDHEGHQLNERSSHAAVMSRCLDITGMKRQIFSQLDDAYKRFAYSHERNSLEDFVLASIPKWDGANRLDDFLINFFRLRDTPINRQVGKYFWLSLYNRITNPGCQAPVCISFIGDQDVGKTFFSVALCRVLMGRRQAAPTSLSLLDIEKNTNNWLRRITGNSIIANIGEMRGYRQTDINVIKEFITRTVDNFDHKFQSGMDTPRQWIVILDGNSYDGFQRDETGNRRFYPMFVNQIDDKNGQPAWEVGKGWKADFSNFEADVWQLMAEAKKFLDENGEFGYDQEVMKASNMVREFSDYEMQNGRGIIKDEVTETALRTIVLQAEMHVIERKSISGVFLTNTELSERWNRREKGSVNFASVRRILTAFGFEVANLSGLGRGYIIRDAKDVAKVKQQFFYGKSAKNLPDVDSDPDFNIALGKAISKGKPGGEF